MKVATASEASRNFAAVLDQVERGETIVITRGGKRLATIAPARAGNGAMLADFLASRVSTPDEGFADDVAGTRELLTMDDPWHE